MFLMSSILEHENKNVQQIFHNKLFMIGISIFSLACSPSSFSNSIHSIIDNRQLYIYFVPSRSAYGGYIDLALSRIDIYLLGMY